MPLRTNLFPSVGNPMSGSALHDPSPRYPHIGATIPLPVSGAPNVAVARGRSMFSSIRRRRSVGQDVRSCGSEFGNDSGAGGQGNGDYQSITDDGSKLRLTGCHDDLLT